MDSDSTRERRESLIVFALIWLGCAGWSGSMTYGRPARPLEPIPARPARGHVLDLAEVVDAAGEVSIPSISAYRDPSIESLASRWHQAWLLGDSQVLLLLSPTDLLRFRGKLVVVRFGRGWVQ